MITSTDGLRNAYVVVAQKLCVLVFPHVRFAVTYHDFRYGSSRQYIAAEIDVILVFATSGVTVAPEYTPYNLRRFGVDTHEFWIQKTSTI
ncbi:MAG: hypothetical protein AAF251_05110 [Pseudomonadota bacterium]